MGISSLRTVNIAMRNWALGLGRILFKFCTAISTKWLHRSSWCGSYSNTTTRVPEAWPECSHHRASVARGSSLGQSGWLTNHWIFFHYRVPNCALSDSEIRSTSTHCAMKGKQSLSSNSFHFKFPFVLFHSFSISTCFGVRGRRRKQE